jgi:hypothetical protein
MGGVRWALSWLVVGAMGLAPILTYCVVRLIDPVFRSKRGGRGRVAGWPEMRGRRERNGETRPSRGAGRNATGREIAPAPETPEPRPIRLCSELES